MPLVAAPSIMNCIDAHLFRGEVLARHRTPAVSGNTRQCDPQRTGYVVAAHKIELPLKVVGRVAWIGVEKDDPVKEGQVLVRSEDDDYRAKVQEANWWSQ